MRNRAIAEVFAELADWLELAGEDLFRIRAYQKAARAVQDTTEDLAEVAERGGLKALKQLEGIGDGTARKIVEFLDQGRVQALEDLRAKFPAGLREMLRIPEFGPKKVAAVWRELGLETVDQLEAAAREGRVAALKGFGKKSEENLLKNIQLFRRSRGRTSLAEATAIAEAVVAALRSVAGGGVPILPAGSLRRGKDTIGDLDILVATKDAAPIMSAFTSLPEVKEVLAHGATKSSVLTGRDLQIDLRAVPPGSLGAALQYFTGSKEHNIAVRERAVRRGLSLNEYAVTRMADGSAVAGATEAEVYAALDLPWIPPELRENRGELAAAEAGSLPELIELGDVRGDLHCHTTWTDGKLSVSEMAAAAQARGYQYLAITDHSKALAMTGGLDEARLGEQIAEITRLNRTLAPFRILTGIEVDILRDGSLDLAEELLDELDFVIASIHSNFKLSRAEMTARMIRAIENPVVDLIAHPTGRVVGAREPYELELGAVIAAAAHAGTMLEINANNRLDLNDLAARAAREAGVTLVINTDAHSAHDFDTMRFGVLTARRAWLTRAEVLNTLPLEELLNRLGRE